MAKLINQYRAKKDQWSEAVMLNNIGFEYLFEGRWRAGIPHFERAAKIFKNEKDKFGHANSRANYWTCRFEVDDPATLKNSEPEIKALRKILGQRQDWRERKAIVLLAKIAEQRGNIRAAIKLVERAVELSEKSNICYPELDRKYLVRLQIKRHCSL